MDAVFFSGALITQLTKRFRDEDMLAHKGGGDSHVAKRKQRNKALEIVFDPKSHK